MASEVQVAVNSNSPVAPGFDSLQSFELMQRVANVFCKSTIAPETFRGDQNFGNCVIAVEMAKRMNVSPLLLMQNMYIVHGNPAFSSKFLISTFNMCGRYSSIKYKDTGKKGTPTWGCIAYTTEKATGEVIEGPEITIAMANAEGWSSKSGSKWKTMPEQMLRYRAAAFMIRTVAPELSMGYQTTDEIIDVTPEPVVEKPINEIHQNANTEELVPTLTEAQDAPQTVKTDIPKETIAEPVKKAEKAAEIKMQTVEGPDF